MEPGTRVRFTESSPEQVRWGGNDDPDAVLKRGEVYMVSQVDVHSYHTKISLVGIKGRFNSVSFEEVRDMAKSKAMTAYLDNLSAAMFGTSRSESIEQGLCVSCKGKADSFTNGLSAREYEISGMCQACQDQTFADCQD